ncbi:MAG: DNA/RNA nuclease SfsA [Alphaproteobacteria bacterium]|nr:MAG: DNA/RNA nuclease SfsA [Alphaproteobacteria bacterium]
MKFEHKLIRGRLIKRYKRFLADILLDDGKTVTAHCANPGSMMGLKEAGNIVWLSPQTNPKTKLDYKWELVDVNDCLVGINTSHPNRLVQDAITDGTITELDGYHALRREMKYGHNSRIDIFLSGSSQGDADCYVEVKSVTLSRKKSMAEFPDSVTARGTKHLKELSQMVADGHRAMMVYLIQRNDCTEFSIAADIDPIYAAALDAALYDGVEAVCYGCNLTHKEIIVRQRIPIRL